MLGGARERGGLPALIDGPSGEVITYAELAGAVDALAAGLQGEGIAKADVVALVGGNSAEWAIAYHAILRAGAVVTPINPLLTPDEVGKQLGLEGEGRDRDGPAGRAAGTGGRAGGSGVGAPAGARSGGASSTCRPRAPSRKTPGSRRTTSPCCRTRAGPLG